MIAGGGVLLLIAIYFYIRNQAKNEARAERTKQENESGKNAKEIHDNLDTLNNDDLNKLL